MLLQELYKPKIDPRAAKAAATYARGRGDAGWNYTALNAAKETLSERLEKLGWMDRSDSGAFSDVFIHPKKNYVLKINKKPDPGYALFVKLIRKYPNKHFPVISDLKRLPLGTKDLFYVYLVEKLQGISWNEEIDRVERNIRFVVENYPEESSIEDLFEGGLPQCFKEDPSLLKAAMTLGLYKGNSSVDLHFDNFMQRPDGTLVIIDPYNKRL